MTTKIRCDRCGFETEDIKNLEIGNIQFRQNREWPASETIDLCQKCIEAVKGLVTTAIKSYTEATLP